MDHNVDVSWMRSPDLHIRLNAELLAAIDQAAARSWQTRSDWIRETIAMRLNREYVIKRPSRDKVWQAELERIKKLAEEAA